MLFSFFNFYAHVSYHAKQKHFKFIVQQERILKQHSLNLQKKPLPNKTKQ